MKEAVGWRNTIEERIDQKMLRSKKREEAKCGNTCAEAFPLWRTLAGYFSSWSPRDFCRWLQKRGQSREQGGGT